MAAGRGGFNIRGTNPMAMMMAIMRNMSRGRGGLRGARGTFRGARGRGGDTAGAGQEQK